MALVTFCFGSVFGMVAVTLFVTKVKTEAIFILKNRKNDAI